MRINHLLREIIQELAAFVIIDVACHRFAHVLTLTSLQRSKRHVHEHECDAQKAEFFLQTNPVQCVTRSGESITTRDQQMRDVPVSTDLVAAGIQCWSRQEISGDAVVEVQISRARFPVLNHAFDFFGCTGELEPARICFALRPFHIF